MICAWSESAIIIHCGFPSSTVCAWEDALMEMRANKTWPWKRVVWNEWGKKPLALTAQQRGAASGGVCDAGGSAGALQD